MAVQTDRCYDVIHDMEENKYNYLIQSFFFQGVLILQKEKMT